MAPRMMTSGLAFQFRNLLARLPLSMACWTSLTGAAWVYDTLTAKQLPSTDMGQWIMYSRYYLGESLPAHRIPLGVSPLLPFALAIATRFSGDSIQAGIVISSVLFFLLLMGVYFVTRELFHDSISAVIAVLLVGFGEHLLVHLTAFGGLPQLAAIVSVNLGFVALLKIQRSVHQNSCWIALSLSCLLVCFFHFPSGPLYLATVAGSLAFVSCHKRAYAQQLIRRTCRYLLIPVAAWTIYFLAFFDQLIEYAKNRAGYYRTGVAVLADYISVDRSFSALVAIALACTFLLPLLTWRRNGRDIRGAAGLLQVWLLVPASFMFASHLLKVGTDYSRFLFYFVQPPLFALAYLLGVLARWPFEHHSALRSRAPGVLPVRFAGVWRWMFVSLIACVAANSARFAVHFYPDDVDYFSVNDHSSCLDVIGQLESYGDSSTVLAPLVESMWIEGLSGRGALFSNKLRFLYRPGEIDRALDADLIATGSDTAVENGFVYLRFQSVPGGIAFNPDVAVYHRGEYVSVVTLQDRLTTIEANIGGTSKKLNLARDFAYSCDAPEVDGSRVEVTSHYSLSGPSAEVTLTKSVVVSGESPVVEINLELVTDGNAGIAGCRFEIGDTVEPFRENNVNGLTSSPVNGARATSIVADNDRLTLYHTEVDGSSIATDLTLSPPISHWTLVPSTPGGDRSRFELAYSIAGQSDANLQVSIRPHVEERLREGLRVHSRSDLLTRYNLGYLVFSRLNKPAQIVYDTLGFPRVYSNAAYVVYMVPGMQVGASADKPVIGAPTRDYGVRSWQGDRDGRSEDS
jgi:hypothetical protein